MSVLEYPSLNVSYMNFLLLAFCSMSAMHQIEDAKLKITPSTATPDKNVANNLKINLQLLHLCLRYKIYQQLFHLKIWIIIMFLSFP